METQLRVQLHMCLMLVFIVLTLKVRSVGSYNVNVDGSSDPDIIGSSPYSQKYLSKSYFEEHASLLDSEFQSFLAHEHALGSCKALPHNLNSIVRVSVLQRNLIGEGSHRRLLSSIKFYVQEAISELPAHHCQAVVIERLPSGVFADPFELQHLVQRGVFVDAAVFGDTNLELPSALSNRSVVEVHMDMDRNVLSRHKKGREVNIDLPLHARYPPLDGNGYSRVEMNAPDILIRCSIEEKSKHENCLWMMTSDNADLRASTLVWRIPSGNKAHSGIVSAVTFISALLSTLFIILTTIYSPNFHSSENLKQS